MCITTDDSIFCHTNTYIRFNAGEENHLKRKKMELFLRIPIIRLKLDSGISNYLNGKELSFQDPASPNSEFFPSLQRAVDVKLNWKPV